MIFACGSTLYAASIDAASEVINMPRVTLVPGGPKYQLGIFVHQGEILPAIDVPLLEEREPTQPVRRIVILRAPGGAAGLVVSRVEGLCFLKVDPPTSTMGDARPSFLDRSTIDQYPVWIIDAATLIRALVTAT